MGLGIEVRIRGRVSVSVRVRFRVTNRNRIDHITIYGIIYEPDAVLPSPFVPSTTACQFLEAFLPFFHVFR